MSKDREKFTFDKYSGELGDFYRKRDAERAARNQPKESAVATAPQPTFQAKVMDPRTRMAPAPPAPLAPPAVKDEEPVTLPTMQATSAKLIEDDGAVEEMEVAEPVAATGDEFTPEELAKIEELRQAPGGIEKAFLHAQRKISQQGSEKSGLEKMVEDILAARSVPQPVAQTPIASTPPPPVVDIEAIAKELGSDILDNTPEKIKKVIEAAVTVFEAKQAAKEQANKEADAEKRIKQLTTGEGAYAGMVTKENAAYLDAVAIAVGSAKPELSDAEVYEKALEIYAKEKNWVKGAPNREGEAMRQAAALTPNNATPPKPKAKVFSRDWLVKLQRTEPAKYAAMQAEIMKAYREGRVK